MLRRKHVEEVLRHLPPGQEVAGRVLRARMNRDRPCWCSWTEISFIILMQEMANAGYVVGYYLILDEPSGLVRLYFRRI